MTESTKCLMCANPFCVLGTEKYEIDTDEDFNPKVCTYCYAPMEEVETTELIIPSKRRKSK